MLRNKKPFYSIVIPTYNHGHLIKKCLDSIIAQTYTNWEVIIVNNFSDDNTIEVVETYQDVRFRLVNNANNGVIAVSRNKGIELAQGDWICLLDSDDWWTPDKLEKSIPYLENFDLIYTDMYICYGDKVSQKSLRGYQVNSTCAYEEMLLKGNPCVNSSVVFRRTLINKVGFLSEKHDLIAVEDFDYWLRLAQHKIRFKHINQKLGFYWLGDSNISVSNKQIVRMDRLYSIHLVNIVHLKLKQEIIARHSYRKARILQLLERYTLAKEMFMVAVHSRNVSIILRSLFFLVVIKLNNGKKKYC